MNYDLEAIVANLLVPDNQIIAQATQELKVFLKGEDAVASLFQLLASHKPEVRQYAGILLRRKILKNESWQCLSNDVKLGIKQNIFDVFLKETLTANQKSLLHLISTIASHDLAEDLWPELFLFVERLVTSPDAKNIEMGMAVLSCVTAACGSDLGSHLDTFLSVCSNALQHSTNHMVPYHAILVMTNILELVQSSRESQETYKALIMPMIEVIKKIATIDQTQAAECLGVFEDLISMEAPLLTPHLPSLLTFLVQAGKDSGLETVLRVKCLDLLCDLVGKNKKVIVRKNLMRGLMEEMFSVMCEQHAGDEDDFDESAPAFASHVFYKMSLNLPPEKFIFTLTRLVDEAFLSTETRVRAAGYIALGVSTEGCSETLKSKEMKRLLKQVYAGMNDPHQEVRSAAMFTLGEFSNYLQPNISKFSKDLIPLLFDCLSKSSFEDHASTLESSEGHASTLHVNRTFFALERFCENLGKEIVEYLSVLMEFFLASVEKAHSLKIKELSISAIGAFAQSAEEEMLPYVARVVDALKPFMEASAEEDQLRLQVKSLETLALLVESLKEVDVQLATDCLALALSLVQHATDPDLKAAIHGLFGSCSIVLKDAMAPHLTTIIPLLIHSLQSTEGIIENYEDEDVKKVSALFDDEEPCNGALHPLSIISSVQLSNSYVFEKGAALEALGVVASNAGASFGPFVDEAYLETTDLLSFPDTDVRKEAVETVGKLSVVASQCSVLETNGRDERVGGMVGSTVEVLLRMARTDEDREVVTAAFEALNQLLKKVTALVMSSVPSVDVLFNLVSDAIKYKLKCQEASLEDEEDEEDEEEYDALLIETAGDLIPCLASASPPDKFNSFLTSTMPIFLKKHSSKVSDRSFAVGALAETVKEMGQQGWQFGGQVYPVMMASLGDEDEEVRSNAAFGVGTLALSANPAIHNHYEEMLKGLSRLMSKETDAMVLDNICAALARMTASNSTLVPVPQMLTTMLSRLPLKEDKEENETILQCIHLLLSQKNVHVLTILPQILLVVADMLCSKQSPEQEAAGRALVREAYSASPETFQSLPTQHAHAINKLQECLQ